MDDSIVVFLAFSSLLKYFTHYMGGNKRPRNAKLVGRVKGIHVYPVKSMSPIDLSDCQCTFAGLEHAGVLDRQWMVIGKEKQQMVTARMQPKMAKIAPSIHDDGMHLDAPGMPTLVLPKDIDGKMFETIIWGECISGFDAGDEAAAWIEKFLLKSAGTYRLIHHAPSLPKRVLPQQDCEWKKECKMQDEVQYQDGFPYLLISSKSLTDLTSKVAQRTGKQIDMPMKQFRPNIEVEGCDPYAEDEWQEVFIADTKFSNKKLCGRCVYTTVNPDLGEKRADNEPLETLNKVRPFIDGAPAFGINLVIDKPGVITVGDPVYATSMT